VAGVWKELNIVKSFRPSALFLALYVLSMPAYALIRLAGDVALTGVATAATAGFLFLFSLAHCIETRGLPRAALMLAVAFAIALLMEYLGSKHGFIFGNYTYTDNLGFKALDQVPVIIPVAWFMMLYPAWETAGLLTQQVSGVIRHASRVGIAALAMTAWDLSLDPRMVADGNWIWHDGGLYFGIPLSNFAGWVITSAMIYAVWTGIENFEFRILNSELHTQNSKFKIQNFELPVWAYIITWVGESMANALFWGGPAVAVWVFLAMGLFAVPALRILIRGNRVAQTQHDAVLGKWESGKVGK
jgi:putative membrane protein